MRRLVRRMLRVVPQTRELLLRGPCRGDPSRATSDEIRDYVLYSLGITAPLPEWGVPEPGGVSGYMARLEAWLEGRVADEGVVGAVMLGLPLDRPLG